MNVAYVFSTPNASYILEKMIVPQLEEDRHGANVVGMFFFVDNNYLLVRGNPTGERLAAISRAARRSAATAPRSRGRARTRRGARRGGRRRARSCGLFLGGGHRAGFRRTHRRTSGFAI